jgi:hypothetical protein
MLTLPAYLSLTQWEQAIGAWAVVGRSSNVWL